MRFEPSERPGTEAPTDNALRVSKAPVKILLCGYFGFGNAGDEALFEAIVGRLRQLLPDCRLSALVADPSRALRLGVEPVPRFHPPAILRALLGADLFLQGGGGLQQDSSGPKSVVYYGGLLTLSRVVGTPAVVLCQGYGPVHRPLLRRLSGWSLRAASLLTFRDPESVEEVVSLGLPRARVQLTADPALLLEPPPPTEMVELLKRLGLSQEIGRSELPDGRLSEAGPLVAVSLRGVAGFPEEEFARALRGFRSSRKARYLLLPFQLDQDLEICRRVKGFLDGEAYLLEEEVEPRQMVGLLGCCDMVFGTRLHALILAAAANPPLYGLSYDPKVERFCRRAGALSCRIEEISSESLQEAWEHLLLGRKTQRETQHQRVEAMKAEVEEAFASALRLLGPKAGDEATRQS